LINDVLGIFHSIQIEQLVVSYLHTHCAFLKSLQLEAHLQQTLKILAFASFLVRLMTSAIFSPGAATKTSMEPKFKINQTIFKPVKNNMTARVQKVSKLLA